MSPQTFIFFGPSGSGKGTQAKLLIEKLGQMDPNGKTLYLETGHMLREFSNGTTLTAQTTKDIIDNGGLMPEFLPIMLWSQFMVENMQGGEHLVIDGISRKLHEAWVLDTALQFYRRENVYIISIKTSAEWATKRLLERGRVDDGVEEVKRRMDWYAKSVVPAIDHFRSLPNYKVVDINGEQSIEAVHAEILEKTNL